MVSSNVFCKTYFPSYGLIGLAVILSGCNAQQVEDALQAAEDSSTSSSESSSSSTSSSECSYVVSYTYDIGVDPSNDFISHDVTVREIVTESTCAEVQVGETQAEYAYSVTRHGTELVINQPERASESFSVSGLTLSMPEISNCDSGSRVSQDLAEGGLDPVGQTVTLQMEFDYTGESCGSTGNSGPFGASSSDSNHAAPTQGC